MRTNQNMEVTVIRLVILFLSMLNLSQSTNDQINCKNKSFVCYDQESYYPCVEVGDSNSKVVLDLQYCPKGLECDDNAAIACQRIESLEKNVSDEDHTSKSKETIDKMLLVSEKNTKIDQNDITAPENEAILTTTSKSDIGDMFTHDTTETSSIQSVTTPYDMFENKSNQAKEKLTTIYSISYQDETNEADTTNSKATQDTTPSTTERVPPNEEVENYETFTTSLDQTTKENNISTPILDNNKISENNSDNINGTSGLNDRNFLVEDLIFSNKEDIDDHVVAHRSSEEDNSDINTHPLTPFNIKPHPTTMESVNHEDATPTTDSPSKEFGREGEEFENFLKLTHQVTTGLMETVSGDEIQHLSSQSEATDLIIEDTSNRNEFGQTTTVDGTESTTKDKTVRTESESTQSTTVASVTNQNETPTAPIFDNNSVQREDEEIAHFHKLTQQVTTSYLGDQTDASTVQDKTANSDPTDASIEDINNRYKFGQTTIVDVTKSTTEHERFATKSGEDLENGDPSPSSITMTSVTNQNETPTAPTFDNNSVQREDEEIAHFHKLTQQVTTSDLGDQTEASTVQDKTANSDPTDASIEDINNGNKFGQTTIVGVTKSTTENERFATKSGDDLKNFDPSSPSTTTTSVTNQYETPTASTFDNNSVQREDEEIAHFHKLTQQVTTSYLGDQTDASTVHDKTANSDPTDASIEDINNGNQFGQTTIVGVTKSTTEDERFVTKSDEDLDNFDPSQPSITMTSVTNQYETPTAPIFDNNSVQREDEEIAHFHKLTQQVTTSYLGDQTEASTVQDKTANSDPTDASIEDINNGNQFGQTTIVGVTKSTTKNERFETKSGDDLENFDPSSPSTTTTSVTNQNETPTAPIFDNNSVQREDEDIAQFNKLIQQVTTSYLGDQTEASTVQDKTANSDPTDASIEDINNGNQFGQTTIVGVTKSTTEDERFVTKSGEDLDNFDPSQPSITMTSVTNQYETPTAPIFDNNSVQREDEEIAHFHKLTQQVTTSYLGDQTEASTVQDKTANSDPTDASIEDINNGNQFGQTAIVDVTKSTTEDERFETKSGDDLENFDPSSPSTTTTSVTNQNETPTAPIFDNNSVQREDEDIAQFNKLIQQVTTSYLGDQTEASTVQDKTANSDPTDASIEDINNGNQFGQTTIVDVTKSTTEGERFVSKSGEDLENFDPSQPSITMTSVTNQYETPTASIFDNNSVQREDEEIAHFHKLTQQVTTSYLGDQTEASTVQDKTANSDPTDASIEDINNGNQFGQTTIVDVTKSTTEGERFVSKSGEDLENFESSSPSTTTPSVTNQYETPTASIFDNNSVQREDEEIAHFHKLTQQVTTSYLGDQTEASTVQDKTVNSDPTDASIEDINNGNKFGQTTIVDVTESTTENERFPTKSGENLKNVDSSSSSTITTSVTNQNETPTAPIFDNNSVQRADEEIAHFHKLTQQVTTSYLGEQTEASTVQDKTANSDPTDATIEDINNGNKFGQTTIVGVTKSTTENERFATKSGEDLENFDPSQPSITMTSVTNQNETPTAPIFDNNSVQREDEEIAHFHKLTQQVTTSDLGDQSEASTIQDRTTISDATKAVVQTTISDVPKPLVPNNRFERESEENLDKDQGLFGSMIFEKETSSITEKFYQITNKESQFSAGNGAVEAIIDSSPIITATSDELGYPEIGLGSTANAGTEYQGAVVQIPVPEELFGATQESVTKQNKLLTEFIPGNTQPSLIEPTKLIGTNSEVEPPQRHQDVVAVTTIPGIGSSKTEYKDRSTPGTIRTDKSHEGLKANGKFAQDSVSEGAKTEYRDISTPEPREGLKVNERLGSDSGTEGVIPEYKDRSTPGTIRTDQSHEGLKANGKFAQDSVSEGAKTEYKDISTPEPREGLKVNERLGSDSGTEGVIPEYKDRSTPGTMRTDQSHEGLKANGKFAQDSVSEGAKTEYRDISTPEPRKGLKVNERLGLDSGIGGAIAEYKDRSTPGTIRTDQNHEGLNANGKFAQDSVSEGAKTEYKDVSTPEPREGLKVNERLGSDSGTEGVIPEYKDRSTPGIIRTDQSHEGLKANGKFAQDSVSEGAKTEYRDISTPEPREGLKVNERLGLDSGIGGAIAEYKDRSTPGTIRTDQNHEGLKVNGKFAQDSVTEGAKTVYRDISTPEPRKGLKVNERLGLDSGIEGAIAEYKDRSTPGTIRTEQSHEGLNANGKFSRDSVSEGAVPKEVITEQIPISNTTKPVTASYRPQREFEGYIQDNSPDLSTATNPIQISVKPEKPNGSDEDKTDLNAEDSFAVETIIRPPDPTVNKDGFRKDPDQTNTFVCKSAGQFPDQKNCSVYHICMDIYIQILHIPASCPPGTLYDRNLQNCTRRPVECSEDNTLQCTTSGVFAHPTDCNRYYKCFWRSLHKKFSLWQFKCPPRMRYDQERRKCVNAPTAATLECGGLSQDSAESPFYCTENGRFPMEYNCDGYYDCKEKKGAFQTKAKFCSPGKLFDTELGRCRRSDLVFCPYEYDNGVDGDGNNSAELN